MDLLHLHPQGLGQRSRRQVAGPIQVQLLENLLHVLRAQQCLLVHHCQNHQVPLQRHVPHRHLDQALDLCWLPKVNEDLPQLILLQVLLLLLQLRHCLDHVILLLVESSIHQPKEYLARKSARPVCHLVLRDDFSRRRLGILMLKPWQL